MHSHQSALMTSEGGDTVSATPAFFVGTNDWTIITPGGQTTTNILIEVNNANYYDANKANHYLNPISAAVRTKAEPALEQTSATSDTFNSQWVSWGNLDQDAIAGSGAYRWIRLRKTDNPLDASFSSYLWTVRYNPQHPG